MTNNEILEFLSEYCVPQGLVADLREYMASEEARDYDVDGGAASGELYPEDSLPAVLDQRMMMAPSQGRGERKWYLKSKSISRTGGQRKTKKTGLCFHHTAVEGGFGIHKSTLRLAQNGTLALPQLTKWPNGIHGDKADRAMALAARIRGVRGTGQSYHVFRCQSGVLVLNLSFDLVSWHGNGANNDHIGWAWDALSSQELPPADMIAEIVYTVKLARKEGHPIDRFVTHSMYSNKPRDPGRQFVEEIMIPAARLTGCTIDFDMSAGKGRPLSTVTEVRV